MDEKELFEQFMHHNIPQEAFDPDQVLAAARKGCSGRLSAVGTFQKRHG